MLGRSLVFVVGLMSVIVTPTTCQQVRCFVCWLFVSR